MGQIAAHLVASTSHFEKGWDGLNCMKKHE
jgi:hypothetical protein